MASRFSLSAAAAVAVFAGASLAHAQMPKMPAPSKLLSTPIDSLEMWDKQVGLLTQLAWGVNAISDTLGPDRAGDTLEHQWNDNILTDEVKHHLDELRDKGKAQSAGNDGDGLKRTLAEAAPIIQGQLYKASLVMGYWSLQDTIAYQQKLLQPWLDRASREERKTVSDRVNGTFDALKKNYTLALQTKEKSLTSGPQLEMVTGTGGAVLFLNEERTSLVKQQAELPLPYEIAPLKRTEPCKLSNAPKPGRSEVGIAPDFPPSESFYPDEMKRRGVTANVEVNVDVSTAGCAETARIAVSSGVKDLDEAGLRYAMAGSYVPAADGDKAVPGTLTFRIKFKLAGPPGKP